MKIGDLVEKDNALAVIVEITPVGNGFTKLHYKLELKFLTEPPLIYSIDSSFWKNLGECPSLLKELL
jgi:hypothetical protein